MSLARTGSFWSPSSSARAENATVCAFWTANARRADSDAWGATARVNRSRSSRLITVRQALFSFRSPQTPERVTTGALGGAAGGFARGPAAPFTAAAASTLDPGEEPGDELAAPWLSAT